VASEVVLDSDGVNGDCLGGYLSSSWSKEDEKAEGEQKMEPREVQGRD